MMQHKSRNAGHGCNNEDVVKSGYLKKLKTMKKKFFVLRKDTGPNHPARLEYYDSEKKFLAGIPPKKPIILSTCFSINRKMDPKHSHVIALYTNNDSLSVAAETETEMNEWLGFLNGHMNKAVSGSEGQSRKVYEHVWLVAVQPRSLGSSKGLTGEHHICLTYKSIALVRVGDCSKKIEFPLNCIRRCGHTGSFFFLGLGRSAVTGAGDIWMHTEDAVIAENMHSIIRKAMHDPCNNMNEDIGPRTRTHSVSNNRSFDGGGNTSTRERCGSMPSRSRTSSEGSVQNAPSKLQAANCSHQLDGPLCLHVTRPQSMYSPSLSSSCSPPFYVLFSPSSSESVESNTSVDEMDGLPGGHNFENNTDTGLCSVEEDNYMQMQGGTGESGSGFHHPHPHPHPPFSLPISSSRVMGASLSKGLVSPVSGCGSEGPTLQSPQDNYLDMASPSERKHLGLPGLSSDQSYMCMERQTQGNQGSENSGYMPMAPLNSPGNVHPSWPSYLSSQVSSPPGSASHSRIPSLVDENTDNYLSMVPQSHSGEPSHGEISARDRTEAYLNMTPTPALPTPIPYSPSEGDSFPEMSPGSSCSFTSGTPSSDHRFPDFIVDKTGSGSYYGCSEDDDSSLDRPIRTNSVGSKPEQYRSRKNRLEVSPAEPARVRAFSVGSRVSLRLGGGRAGQVTSGTIGATSASITEFSPSIKEKGKQVKSKSTSAPILGSSPISNSWSGTPGTFFRGFLQAQSQERNEDLMEFDFTKNKSCDSISAEKEKKSSSFESIKRTLTGQRHRSNSKSSGNGKSSMFDSIKRDKKKSESELSNKSIDLSERNRLREVDINPSPLRKTSESHEGYLPMKPAILSQSLCTSEYVDMSSRESLNHHFPERYLNMSVGGDRLAWPSSGTHEDYVDMSQGKGLGLHTIPSVSSSSVNSNSSSSAGARVRKISSTINPMSSQDSSQLDEYMTVDLRSNADSSSHSHDGDKSRKKDKKSMKRKSFKDSSKKKKSDPISVTGRGGDAEGSHEVTKKGTSPLQSITTFWGRKNSSGTTPPKTPLSPTGSPLPKPSRGTPSPFSSLTRSKNRDDRDSRKESASKESVGGMTSSVSSVIGTSCIEESSREAEESAILGDGSRITSSSQPVPNITEPMSTQREAASSSGSKRSSGIFEPPHADAKEESQSAAATESPGPTTGSVSQPPTSSGSDQGAYVNLTPATCEKSLPVDSRQRKLSDIPASSDYMNISPLGSSKPPESDPPQSREYMNMCPGSLPEPAPATPTPPPPLPAPSESSTAAKSDDAEKSDKGDKDTQGTAGASVLRLRALKDVKGLSVSCAGQSEGGNEESGYLLMTPGQPSPKPLSPQTVTHRPDIPVTLLDHSNPSLTATLERLNLNNSGANNGTERCRSHSGPGAPEGSAVSSEVRVKKQLSEPRAGSSSTGNSERAASACSSPVSYSPPTSPTLGGSVSSVSSLSEGGLSSASSTCTVVNVGVARREAAAAAAGGAGRVTDTQADSTVHSTAAAASSQQSLSAVGGGSKDSGLNYVSLDLGPSKTVGVRPSPRTARRSVSGTPAPSTATQEPVAEDDDEPLSYAQIDFTKSEGLRTTSLSRDHRH